MRKNIWKRAQPEIEDIKLHGILVHVKNCGEFGELQVTYYLGLQKFHFVMHQKYEG